MNFLLIIENVKIYIKMSYICSYMFRSTVYWVPCRVRHGTQYTHHNLKHMLPQHRKTYNDVFLLINSTKV